MDADTVKKCGCKGIRTCLICEKASYNHTISENEKTFLEDDIHNSIQYAFCPHCNLCWPLHKAEDVSCNPLYLSKIQLFLNFLTVEDENFLIDEIDKIPWVLSQSGRRKQDFGPKVNFKKKKARIGNFKGFPQFTEKFLQKLSHCKELKDFHPVELCHLEYCPDRGSAIEPHIDDSWIWGERLITINLAAATILTLSIAKSNSCSCLLELSKEKARMASTEMDCNVHHLDCEDVRFRIPPHSPAGSQTLEDMCSTYRSSSKDGARVAVDVLLPPRSMLILAGCARHNWFHAIKRQNVRERRLAMTFRELAEEFLSGGSEEKLGNELLVLGTTFYDS